MLGNDDAACNEDVLEKHHGTLWGNIRNRRIALSEGYDVVGYPYVPITPFGIKDFEKFDTPLGPLPDARLDGLVSGPGGWSRFTFNPADRASSIETDLQQALFCRCPERTIYVFHAPPYGTHLDTLYSGRHVGSRAIRAFVQQQQPHLVLSGHIHKTVDVSGTYKDSQLGALCMTASNHPERVRVAFLLIDPDKPELTERILA